MSLDFLPASVYDHAASVLWADRVGARPKQCYWNALTPVLVTQGSIGVYVEGFVLAPYGMVLEHGWIETPEGQVIDPTFPICSSNEPQIPYRYLPALRFPYKKLKDKAIEQFPLHNDGGRQFRLEREEPWVSTRMAAYAARNRLEAVTADKEA